MTKPGIRVFWLETITLALLLSRVYWPAFSLSLAGVIPMLHALFLLGGYILLRHQARRAHSALGPALFALTVSLLLIEITIQHYTGLHLNRFVLSLVAQPQALEQIGISGYLFGGLFLIAAVAFALSWRFRPEAQLSRRKTLSATVSALLVSQLLYGFLIYGRDPGLIQNERNMPFFIGVHHYYADRVFEPLFGKRSDNPFAVPFDRRTPKPVVQETWKVTSPRNILLVVVDSLRAADIAQTPALAPNLVTWASRGHFSLSHNSVANCTHFSMHTLFTGALPTNFNNIRRGNSATGLLAALNGTEYSLQSTEAFPLEWYDLARSYMPGVDRTVIPSDVSWRDAAAVTKALNALPASSPWFHFLYLNGPHFPYDATPGEPLTVASYQNVITQTDTLIGSLLDGLAAKGVLEDTLVIITSDHGEEVLENGRIGHGSMLNNLQTEVPLLILGARQPTAWIRSHRDIMPYIRAEIGAAPLRAAPRKPQIRVGCDYAYPASFSLKDEDAGWIDFQYENGLLSPGPSKGGTEVSAETIRQAGLKLIEIIKGP